VTEGWLVIPAYNEAAGIAANLDAISAVVAPFGREQGVHFTVLVVDDGSRDETLERARRCIPLLSERGVTLRLLPLVRNFGHQAAVIAGLREAATAADFAITIDADGEHPHALIPSLFEEWQRGAPIVHTMRLPHRDLSLVKRRASAAYYSLLARISNVRIKPGMADFKLWDGALLRQLVSFLPACGSTRVFAAWLAPNAPIVPYEQHVEAGRTSRFTFSKNLSLALDGLVRYSDLPLRLSLIMSAFAVLVGILQGSFVIWASLTNRVVPGWSSVMIIVAFFGAMQSFSVGVLGEYLLRIQFRKSLPLSLTNPRLAESPPAPAAQRSDVPAVQQAVADSGWPEEHRSTALEPGRLKWTK
jgi:glycosyltransferase involved in cell wall biosynthesis